MRKHLQIVEINKASTGTRFANYLIDLILFYILIIFISAGLAFAYSFLYNVPIDEVFAKLENINSFLDRVITLISYAIIMFITEAITKGRSLGKLITGTKVITIDGKTPSTYDLFIRNISRAVPFDQLSFLGNNGWHDSWSETRVVPVKKYEEAVRLALDLENIGKE